MQEVVVDRPASGNTHIVHLAGRGMLLHDLLASEQ